MNKRTEATLFIGAALFTFLLSVLNSGLSTEFAVAFLLVFGLYRLLK